jgi:hydrogenase nickel incorporation protein HypA/HybF
VTALHEMAIAESVLRIAADHADGRHVTKVYLKVGYLRQVVPSALSFGFELISQGTPLEGADLVIDTIPARGACVSCGDETRLEAFPLQCGTCGGFDLDMTAGEELYVESLELEEREVQDQKLTSQERRPEGGNACTAPPSRG